MRQIGIVLAGGASRRMGVDKLSLPLSSESKTTILEHVVDCVSKITEDVYIAHAPTPSLTVEQLTERIGDHVHFLQDETWYNGPLGVLARLSISLPKSDLVYIVAGDLPGLNSNVLKACGDILLGNGKKRDAALVERDGKLQPLLGCYQPHALSTFFDEWKNGETRLMPVLAKLKIEPVVSEKAMWPAWWTKPVHTPEDYASWESEWRRYHAT